MNRLLGCALTIAATFASNAALAHAGHELAGAGFVAGFLHPLLGFDHLLAMLVVGIWAAQLGGKASGLLPLSFVGVMTLGAVLALQGFVPPAIEPGIAASLLILGLLVVSAARLPLMAAMAVTAGFAIFHGAAHGAELPQSANPLLYAAGFVLATAGLHAAGLMLGKASRISSRLAGSAAIAGGVVATLVQVLA